MSPAEVKMATEKDQAFVEFVAKELTTKPEKVEVKRTIDEMGVLLELTVDKDDMAVIIGKEGRTAKAIRTLLRVIGAKNDARVNLKIVEPEGSEHVPKSESTDDSKKESAEDKEETEDDTKEDPSTDAQDDDKSSEEVEETEGEAEDESPEEEKKDDEEERPMADLDL